MVCAKVFDDGEREHIAIFLTIGKSRMLIAYINVCKGIKY